MKCINKDVTVLNRFATGRNRGVVKAKVIIDSQIEMKKKIKGNNEQLCMAKITHYETHTKIIIRIGKKITKNDKKKENCISKETRKLMKKCEY